ncbi:MAG TPA: thioredoxin family protein [Thermoanaerobaculia bacterium]
MREKTSSPRSRFLAGVLMLVALSTFAFVRSGEPEATKPPAAKTARSGATWHQGAAGFQKAMQEAEADGLPLAVYFYTDWCPYCRQLDNELLNKRSVEEHLTHVVKVRINPEKGQAERQLANQYKVSGYPSFFMHPMAKSTPVRVQGQVREGNGWRVKTPAEFIATLREAAGG